MANPPERPGRRVLFATFGSLGDLHPPLAVAVELRRRGYQVGFATVSDYREKITALGLAFHQLRPEVSLNDEALVRRIVDSVRGPEYLLREVLLANVRPMHADLLAAVRGADLLICSELVYAAPIVAEQLGISRVSYALAPLSYLSAHDPSVLPVPWAGHFLRALPPGFVRAIHLATKLVTHSWWRPVRELRRELGLARGANPIATGKFAPLLDLALFSRTLQSPQPDWPPQTVQTGFVFHQENNAALPPAVERFLEDGDAPIVFTLGSSAVHAARDFYEESARAAEVMGRRALLLLGNNAAPRALPPSILAWDYLPYAQIFPRAAAVVHSGGVGTTAQVLRAGRPSLVMPFAFDQFDNAARVVRLGAGRMVPRSRYRRARALHELGALLSDPRYAHAATQVAHQIRAEEGITTACAAIERLLRATPASSR